MKPTLRPDGNEFIKQENCWKESIELEDAITHQYYPKPTNQEEADILDKDMNDNPQDWYCADCDGKIRFNLDKDCFEHVPKKIKVRIHGKE